MKYLIGISPSKTEENKNFVDDITSSLTSKSNILTKGHTYASILSYTAVDKYDAIFIDWELLEGSFADFYKRLTRINKSIPIVIFCNEILISGELCTPCDLLFGVIPKNEILGKTPEIIKRIKKYKSIIKEADNNSGLVLRPNGFNNFIGNSDLSLLVYQQLIRVSQTDFTTLILGGAEAERNWLLERFMI